jgi:SAM-dependent methyltransferase
MYWRIKALAQNMVAALPDSVSDSLYYRLQRMAGGLRAIDPMRDMNNAAAIVRTLRAQHTVAEGKTFFLLGTGRTVNVPIGLWLCGAARVIVTDLKPDLRPDLVVESLRRLRDYRVELEARFSVKVDQDALHDRLDRLVALPDDSTAVLSLAGIDYRVPSDTASSGLPDGSVDFYCSSNVFEHVSPETMRGMLHESRRLLAPGGLFLHRMDLSDHFSHTDRSLSAVHFLRYGERAWARIAGNRYMYHNRMRGYEYDALLRGEGARILLVEEFVDVRAQTELAGGNIPLDPRFAGHTPGELAVSYLTVVGNFDAGNNFETESAVD